ncbi:MAG: hypothetical protein U0O32_02245 [Collinsella sp.]
MIEWISPEATPESKQPSDTKHILGFNPNHLMESTTVCVNIDTDSDVKETYYRDLAPALFTGLE